MESLKCKLGLSEMGSLGAKKKKKKKKKKKFIMRVRERERERVLSCIFPSLSPDAAQRHTPSLIDSLSVTPTAMTAEQKAMEACCSGDIHALCTLLQAGVDVNYTSPDTSVSLFHMAANYGQV